MPKRKPNKDDKDDKKKPKPPTPPPTPPPQYARNPRYVGIPENLPYPTDKSERYLFNVGYRVANEDDALFDRDMVGRRPGVRVPENTPYPLVSTYNEYIGPMYQAEVAPSPKGQEALELEIERRFVDRLPEEIPPGYGDRREYNPGRPSKALAARMTKLATNARSDPLLAGARADYDAYMAAHPDQAAPARAQAPARARAPVQAPQESVSTRNRTRGSTREEQERQAVEAAVRRAEEAEARARVQAAQAAHEHANEPVLTDQEHAQHAQQYAAAQHEAGRRRRWLERQGSTVVEPTVVEPTVVKPTAEEKAEAARLRRNERARQARAERKTRAQAPSSQEQTVLQGIRDALSGLSRQQQLEIIEDLLAIEGTRNIFSQSSLSRQQQLEMIRQLMDENENETESEPENEGTGIVNFTKMAHRKFLKHAAVPLFDSLAVAAPLAVGHPELVPAALAASHAGVSATKEAFIPMLGKNKKREDKLQEMRDEEALMNKYKISGKGIMNQPRSRSVGSDMLSPMAAATMGHSRAMNMKLKLEKDMAEGRRKQMGLVGVSGNLLGPGSIPALQSQPQQNFQFRHTISSPTYHPIVYGNNGLYS